MQKLNAYESALTLFGRIFSQIEKRRDRYFLSALKFDLVFFFFALIWNRNKNGSERDGRLFYRNFNEWQFGKRYISYEKNEPELWDGDKDYFREDRVEKRNGDGLAVLSYGLDLERVFAMDELKRKQKISAVIDWKGGKKWRFLGGISFYYFLFKNIIALFKIHKLLVKNARTNVSWFGFLRYFAYYTFHSARIQYFLRALTQNNDIGKVIFSDIDNVWGNSFMLWSRFYGFRQIVYPHGSSLYFNQRRYFEPDVYYVFTTYLENIVKNSGIPSKIVRLRPKWLRKYNSYEVVKRDVFKKLAFVTGMEKNLEISFNDKEILLNYLRDTSRFSCQKGLSLFIKSHKLLDWHKEYDLMSERFDCVSHIRGRWNIEDLKQIDVGILAVTETTLALQLLYVGVPVITCSEIMSEIWTKHFSAPRLQFVVNSKKELLELLERLRGDKEFYLKAQEETRSISSRLLSEDA